MSRPAAHGLLLVAGAASSWGLWSLVTRPSGLGPEAVALVVFVAMGVASLLAIRFDRPDPIWDRATVRLLAANIILDAINVLTFFGAMAKTTIAIAVLTHYFAPILVAVFAPVFDRVVVPAARPAALVATLGLALVLEPWSGQVSSWTGAILGTISAFAYAGNVFVVRRLAPRIGSGRTVSYHALGAAVIILPFVWSDLGAMTADGVGLVAAGACVIGAGSGVAFVSGLTLIGPSTAGVLTFLEPLVAVVVGWLAWGERLSWMALLGGGVIIGSGVVVVLRAAATDPDSARSDPPGAAS